MMGAMRRRLAKIDLSHNRVEMAGIRGEGIRVSAILATARHAEDAHFASGDWMTIG
jgi:hypothetical protein